MQANPSVVPRHAITAPDADISTLDRFPCEGAAVVRIGANCDTAKAALTCRVIWWDALGAFCGASDRVVFTADDAPLEGTLYLATPSPDAWFAVGGPSAFSLHVDSVSAGAWTLTPMAQ